MAGDCEGRFRIPLSSIGEAVRFGARWGGGIKEEELEDLAMGGISGVLGFEMLGMEVLRGCGWCGPTHGEVRGETSMSMSR